MLKQSSSTCWMTGRLTKSMEAANGQLQYIHKAEEVPDETNVL